MGQRGWPENQGLRPGGVEGCRVSRTPPPEISAWSAEGGRLRELLVHPLMIAEPDGLAMDDQGAARLAVPVTHAGPSTTPAAISSAMRSSL